MREPAAEMAHHGLCEFHQPHGDAAAVHQLAREHEEGDGHQREAVHAVVDVAVEQRDVLLLPVQPQEQARSRQQTEEHRQADHQEEQKERQEPDQHHSVPNCSSSAMAGSLSSPPSILTTARRISSRLTEMSKTRPTSNEAIIQLRGTRNQLSKLQLVGT